MVFLVGNFGDRPALQLFPRPYVFLILFITFRLTQIFLLNLSESYALTIFKSGLDEQTVFFNN